MTRIAVLRLLAVAAAIAAGAVVVEATRYGRDDRWSLVHVQLEQIASAVALYRSDTHRFQYGVDADGRGFVVFTLGRDGRLGGTGADADIQRGARDQIPRK